MELTIQTGAAAGRAWNIDRPVALGRSASSDIVLPDAGISGRHATLRPVAGGIEVNDLGSSNGTYVGGERLRGPRVVRPGETVEFSRVSARVMAGAGVRAAGSAPQPISIAVAAGGAPVAPRPVATATPVRRLLTVALGACAAVAVVAGAWGLAHRDDAHAGPVPAPTAAPSAPAQPTAPAAPADPTVALQELVDRYGAMLDAYWAQVLTNSGQTYESPQEVKVAVDSPCGSVKGNAFYCIRLKSIYLDPALLEEHRVKYGEYSAAFILAHEWGHHMQNVLSVKATKSVQIENQADCFAGGFTRYLVASNAVTQETADRVVLSLMQFGDKSWDAGRTGKGAHGSPGNRIDAYNLGYKQGSAACIDATQFPR